MQFRLAAYDVDGAPGTRRAGVVIEDRFYDAAALTGSVGLVGVLDILEQWSANEELIAGAGEQGTSEIAAMAVPTSFPALFMPPAIYAAGANYQQHVDNMFRRSGQELQPSPRDVGADPFHFMKSSRSVVGTPAVVERISECLDYEIEVAVVIGRRAVEVTEAHALEYVAGYSIANDLSARDRFVRLQVAPNSPFRYDFNVQKNFPDACPFGPWLVPARDIPDPQALRMRTWVDGELRQDGNTSDMIYSIAEQIAFLSRRCTLYPGDVVLTGTPAGVGAERGLFLASGNVVRMEVEHIGELTTKIA